MTREEIIARAHDAVNSLSSDHRFQAILDLAELHRQDKRDRMEVESEDAELHRLQGEAKSMKWFLEMPKRALINKDKRTQ